MEISATLIFIAIVLATAASAVTVTSRLLSRRAAPLNSGGPTFNGTDILRRYRFREGYLLSDIERDDAFINPGTDRTAAYKRLIAALAPFSPELLQRLDALQDRGEAFLVDGRIGRDAVSIGGRIEEDDVLVLSVGPSGEGAVRQTVESATLEALQGELADLRAALDLSAAPMWREDAKARVIWANSAYFQLLERIRGGEEPGWPLPRLFAEHLEPAPAEGTYRRCDLDLPDRDEVSWYEITRDPLPGGAAMFTAHPADRIARAESSLKEFQQTTAKTFAALPVGLAVFDRRRELVTFNPALVALTNAGPEFLLTRPDLRAFLDRLREKQRIPEPRDYRSWRDQITKLEEGAESGTYQELWELPEGKTFRIMGRPHPDGAIAFMFEDVSAEVSLTRQFRADLDMFQAILDAVPAAIAVFQTDGSMIGTNEGYGRLWGSDPKSLAAMPHLEEVCADWAARCLPTGIWGEIRQFVAHEVERAPWAEEVQTRDGVRLAVRMSPARGRATVVQFQPLDISLTDPLAEIGSVSRTPLLDTARKVADSAKAARRA